MESDSSSLSDPPPSDDDKSQKPRKPILKLVNGKLGGFGRKKATSPPSSPEPDQADLGREVSPPHEDVLADNPDIAVIVMFRSRFDAAFPKNVPHVGPQDVEAGVAPSEPSEVAENLLCALLGLALNRKKNPERGHYGRALEDCISSMKGQWPRSWANRNLLAGGKTFQTMFPIERLDLLRTLVHWSLATSEAINTIIKDQYKQTRKDDDINQPLSVQPWGLDTRKRKFYLIEGQIDAPFRVYRESERKAAKYAWISVAGTIDEAQKLARDLRAEKAQGAHRLAARITNAIPVFEDREDKRKRREYRKAQKERFVRPEPGFSLYEGRTRGKRMRYTYGDEDEYGTDDNRRSSRNSRMATPADGPTFTASGRLVRSAFGKSYGDRVGVDGDGESRSRKSSPLGVGNESEDFLPRGDGRERRKQGRTCSETHEHSHLGNPNHVHDFDDESDAESTGEEWAGDDQDFEGKFDDEEDEHDDADDGLTTSEDELGLDMAPKSLVVRLKCGNRLSQVLDPTANAADARVITFSPYLSDVPQPTAPEATNVASQPATNIPQGMPSRTPFLGPEQTRRHVLNGSLPLSHVKGSPTTPLHSAGSAPSDLKRSPSTQSSILQPTRPSAQSKFVAASDLNGAFRAPADQIASLPATSPVENSQFPAVSPSKK